MNQVLLNSSYLPLISQFPIRSFTSLIYEKHEHYQKQSLRNRSYILTSQGPQMLNVPVQKYPKPSQIVDIKADYSENWVLLHKRALQTAYSKSPFFEDYFPYIEDVLDQKPAFLWDLNMNLVLLFRDFLGYGNEIKTTEGFMVNPSHGMTDWRMHLKTIEIPDALRDVELKTYSQNFGKAFVKNLSIVDLLFNEGPQSIEYLP